MQRPHLLKNPLAGGCGPCAKLSDWACAHRGSGAVAVVHAALE
jgi:hypothetical protein